MDYVDQNLEVYPVKHLPIIRMFAEKIGLVEILNQLIPSEMDVSPGIYFLGMILDTLSGRSPLYRLEEFFEGQDTELLLGEKIKAKSFNDENVSRVMDKAFDVGTIKIFTEVARRAMFVFDIQGVQNVHFDTTSVNVFGDFDYDYEEEPFEITRGYSKDKRPDLKQFMVSMLCVGGNIPIFGKTEDGNASDKTVNNEILSNISSHMAKCGLSDDAFVYIADSAVVTEKNFGIIDDNILYITRLPAKFKECSRVIKEAINANNWVDIGTLNETSSTEKRPAAYYRYYETNVDLYGQKHRAIVFHSSANDRRRQKRIDRILKKDLEKIEKKAKKNSKVEYYCIEDAKVAAEALSKEGGEFYTIETQIIENPKYKSGRPKDGVKKLKKMLYSVTLTIEENKEVISKLRDEGGCFVLISNLPTEGENSKDAPSILKAYKEQHGIEKNFSFLKDPVIVNSIFLKKPKRIEVLGLVLLLSLLIWRLIEKSMRDHIEKTGSKITGWDNKQTERPTSFMMTTKFSNVLVIKVGDQRKLNRPFNKAQKEFLNALGIDPEDFIRPRSP